MWLRASPVQAGVGIRDMPDAHQFAGSRFLRTPQQIQYSEGDGFGKTAAR